MENDQRKQTITIKDLWGLFLGKIYLFIIIPIVCVGIAYIQNKLFVTPKYESTATLYILKQENENNYQYTNSDFSLALDVVNDCTYILKSHAVLDEVMETLELNMSYRDLYSSINTNNPSDTRVLEVTVSTESPELSKQIADQVCIIGTDKITDAMGFKQVNLYENGLLSNEPCNRLGLIGYLLIVVISEVIIFSIILIIFVFDDQFKNDEDIERYLGLSVLGDIPNVGDNKKNKYSYAYVYGQKRKEKE